MKIVVLYRPNSEFARVTEDFIRDYQAQEGDRAIEVVDVDSRQGIAMMELYDVMQPPAIMAVQDNGSPQKVWVGQLPLMNEVASYARL